MHQGPWRSALDDDILCVAQEAWRTRSERGQALSRLEVENAKLKRIVVNQMLDMSAMKELLQKYV